MLNANPDVESKFSKNNYMFNITYMIPNYGLRRSDLS